MTAFLQTALTFPTVLWSVLLALCAAYWLLAAGGLLGGEESLEGGSGSVMGLASRFGLGGVPVMLTLSLLTFFGWLCTYFFHLLLLPELAPPLRFAASLAAPFVALIPAVMATSLLLRPFQALLQRLSPLEAPSLVGRVARVTTPVVDARSGMAALDDGGAGLLLQVRSPLADPLVRGDLVLLVEYDPADNSYLVIPEYASRT